MVSPPIWRVPTSKETRVRVEGFSKISATMRPLSGWSSSGVPLGRPPRAVFIARAWSIMARRAVGSVLWMSRKCWVIVSPLARPAGLVPPGPPEGIFTKKKSCRLGFDAGGGAVEAGDGFGDIAGRNGQRRQQAQHIVGGGNRQQVLGIAGLHHLGIGGAAFQAEDQALAADLFEHVGMRGDQPFQLLAQMAGAAVDLVEKAGLGHDLVTVSPTAQPSGLPP